MFLGFCDVCGVHREKKRLTSCIRMIGQTVASRGHFGVQKIILTGPERPEGKNIGIFFVSDLAKS